MSINRKIGSAIAVSALALTVTACNTALPIADESSVTTATPLSPLEEFMSSIEGFDLSVEDQQRQLDAQIMRREELIAQCMTEAGFQYIPNSASGGGVVISESTYSLEDRDWVSQWGYGWISSPDRAQASDTDSVPEMPVDPNQEYLDSLSESERDAWQNTLWGPLVEYSEDEPIPNGSSNQVDQGCWDWADEQIQQDDGLADIISEFAPLLESIDQMRNELYASNRFATINAEWASCMADAGFPGMVNQGDAWNMFNSEMESFYETWNWEEDGDPIDSPEMATLQDREVEVALADLDCRTQTNFRAQQSAIVAEVENQFIHDNRAALDALRDALEQRR